MTDLDTGVTAGAPPSDPAAAAAPSLAKASPELVLAALSEVYDPEIGIDIVSLGLIYGSTIDDDGLLTIDMTLTTPYCPMGSIIQGQAHAVCHGLPGVNDVKVQLVWSPPWDPRTMASEEARLELGIY
jgi:metal-sulfur cluster biosynthetic enzyme